MIDLQQVVVREVLDHLLLVWVGVALVGAFVALRVTAFLRRRTGLGEGSVVIQEDADNRAAAKNLWDARHGLFGKPDLSMREPVPGVGPRMVATELKPLQRRKRLLASDEAQAVTYGILHRAVYGREAADFARMRYGDVSFDVELTEERTAKVLRAAEDIRRIRAGAPARRNHRVAAKCAGCSMRDACDERVDTPGQPKGRG